MAKNPSELSIIIPVHAKDEQALATLLPRIKNLGHEIVISREPTRAKAMNVGAAKATRKFLLFLHDDSSLTSDALGVLQQSLMQKPESLHYFRLAFSQNDSTPKYMHLNAWGANMRSKFLKTPFGDQGLTLRKDLFLEIKGFPEDTPIGEDHLFVWNARRHGIKLHQIPATITTRADKYARDGWLRTTLRYQRIWIAQALPQLLLLLRGR